MKLIMQNKANFQKSQMFITAISTTNYNEKLTMDTWSKRTQTNPTCGEQGRTICSELACPELVEWVEPISNGHSMQGGNPLKILKILTVRHLTYQCNSLKYWFSYGYGNFYEKLFGEKR
jgi:hypothetical protein